MITIKTIGSARRLIGLLLLTASVACTHPQSGPGDATSVRNDAGEGADAGPIDGGQDAGPADAGDLPTVVTVTAAVSKAKNLLTGLPATDAEVATIRGQRSELPAVISQWMATPQYRQKMMDFFVTSFQQDQWEFDDLTFQFRGDIPFKNDAARIQQNLRQSFARTALQLIDEGLPFTSFLTTKRYMMTPAVMVMYATVDVTHVDDGYNLVDLFQRDMPTAVTLQSTHAVPLEDAVDPNNANFMKFYDPSIASSYSAGCPYGTISYPSPADFRVLTHFLYHYEPFAPMAGCTPPAVPTSARFVRDTDFTDWKMVSIRQPHAGESATRLYDLPAMRTGNELVLHTPRVSFFTTPAFFARWQTNDSNQHRVSINQTMIVALGQPIDLTNTTHPASLAALNQAHAAPGTACYDCHQSLDPMRQFFSQSYTYYFSTQDSSAQMAMNGQFAFHDVTGSGSHIEDLGALLASHPQFAAAWVQKLCTWANSVRCDDADPEFQRLVSVFVSSNYSWNELVKALFASPLVTNLWTVDVPETTVGVFPVTRRDHLCALLSNRLGTPDLCGLDATTPTVSQVLSTIAGSWPSDQYSRGSPVPAQATDSSPMLRGGMENLCSTLAQRFVDDGASGFVSTDPMTGTQAVAVKLMGLTSDRIAGPLGLLREHFDAARQAGADAKSAMQSTFVLGCLSPYVAGVGQ